MNRQQGLNERQHKFIKEYRRTGHGTKSAMAAGYSPRSAHAIASWLLKNVKIRKELERLRDKETARVEARIELNAVNTLEELRRILHFDPANLYDANGDMLPVHELPPEVRACIASVESREIFAGEGENRRVSGRMVRIKFWSKTTAIIKAMEHFNLIEPPPPGRAWRPC